MTDSLSHRLKTATETHHRSVERTGFMNAMITGDIDRAAYVRYLRNLHPVYEALEAGMEANANHPVVSRVWFPSLARTRHLEADLGHIHGPDWREAVPVSDEALAYAERIRAEASSRPHLLAAHGYLRYMGDLSGGLILRKVLGRTLALDDDELGFYDYPDVTDAERTKDELRERYDGLVLENGQADEIIAEAIEGYEAHGRIFDAIR